MLPSSRRNAGQQRAEHDAAREDADRDLGDHVGDQRDQRQDPARRRREAPLEELRHRVDARPDVERHQHPAEHQQAPGVQLVVRERDAAGGAGAGQADEVLRADVGGEDRRADHEPAEVAAGQEVVVGSVPAAPDDPPRHCEQQGEVGQHDEPVEEGHGGRECIPEPAPPSRATTGAGAREGLPAGSKGGAPARDARGRHRLTAEVDVGDEDQRQHDAGVDDVPLVPAAARLGLLLGLTVAKVRPLICSSEGTAVA